MIRTVLSLPLLVGLLLSAAEAQGQVIPIPLDYQRVGSEVVLSWTNAAFSLQSAPTVQGTFTNVPGATSPHTNTLSGAQAYFRLLGVDTPSGMVLIPAGTFTMGATTNMGHESEAGEVPQHAVYVSAFYMDRYEVTKALWDEVKAWNAGNGYGYENAGSGKATNHPVQMVNWRDCVKWCNARSEKEGRTPCYYNEAGLTTVYKSGTGTPYGKWDASGYRLPTEAEWEKAARGGASGHRFPWSDSDDLTHSRANYWVMQFDGVNTYAYDKNVAAGFHPAFDEGGYPYTSPVGYFAANGYGLYDMAGNVWEWCWDWSLYNYYGSSPGSDPVGPASGSSRVTRGGTWSHNASFARCARRGSINPASAQDVIGFRCVRGL